METCTPYLECTNKNESWESLFKRLIVEQPDGSLAVRTCCADAVVPPVELALILEWDDIANVPVADAESVSDWNTFFGLPTNGDPFTSVTVAGNSVYLYGGGNMTLTNGETGYACWEIGGNPQLFEGNSHIKGIDDQAGVIVAVADACFYGYDCDTEESISILETCNLPNCLTAGEWCFNGNTSLTNVVFSALTTAGEGCFNDCTSLASHDFSSLITAGISCFNSCISITNIDIPTLITIGDGCFVGCASLTSMLIPLCIALGTDCTDNSVFEGITGLTITVTCDASLLTCNAGAPDGDLCTLAANNTITVNGAPLAGCP